MRLQRKGNPIVHSAQQQFEIGKGIVVKDGSDVTLIASGAIMLSHAISAAEELEKQGIKAAVIDMHTVKPLDEELVLSYAKKTGAIVTCENAQMIGGLGGAVAEFLSENHPTIVRRAGVKDLFGEVGQLDYLIDRFELTPKRIVDEALLAITKK